MLVERKRIVATTKNLFFIYTLFFLLPRLIRNISGPDYFMHSSNKWFTIFGLQFNTGWRDAYNFIPSAITSDVEQGEYVRGLVLNDLVKNPLQIPKSVLENLVQVLISVGDKMPGPSYLSGFIMILCLAFILWKSTVCISRNRDFLIPAITLLLLPIGELLFLGVFFRSEFIRTLSSSYIVSGGVLLLILSGVRFNDKNFDFETRGQKRIRVQRSTISFTLIGLGSLLVLGTLLGRTMQTTVPIWSKSSHASCNTSIFFLNTPSPLVQIAKSDWIRRNDLLPEGLRNTSPSGSSLFSVTARNSSFEVHTFHFYLQMNSGFKGQNKQIHVCLVDDPKSEFVVGNLFRKAVVVK
jgi:hypothetical protein